MKTTRNTISLMIILMLASCAVDTAKSPASHDTVSEQDSPARSEAEPSPTIATAVERTVADREAPAELEQARPMADSLAGSAGPRPSPRPAKRSKRKSRHGFAAGGHVQEPQRNVSEQYTNYGVNEMTRSVEDRLSTFSIDVDTGAYTIARKKLNAGQIPPAASVRVEEYLNYFRYDYPSPDRGAFGVHLEAAPSPFTADTSTKLLRVGVQGKTLATAERKPVHLTFLVDVSGSMTGRDKLPLATDALKLLTKNLQPEDSVAIATYAGRVARILPPTGMHQRGRILEALGSLRSGGGTGMNDGMALAYEMAMQAHKPGHVSRVIVLSDGDANIGPSSHDDILKGIKSYVDEGITMTTIGFGMGNYKDTMMEQLANQGNGNYYYIDTIEEARKVFGDQLDGTLQVIAKDVKIQVEFDPDKVPSYRLIGYENRDIADKDFRNDKVDAGEIGAGHSVTALYEIQVAPEAQGKLATVRIRHKEPQGHTASEQEFYLRDHDVRGSLADASRDFQFAAAVAGFAELLRESPYAEGLSFDLIEEVARGATTSQQVDRNEFLGLIERARRATRG